MMLGIVTQYGYSIFVQAHTSIHTDDFGPRVVLTVLYMYILRTCMLYGGWERRSGGSPAGGDDVTP